VRWVTEAPPLPTGTCRTVHRRVEPSSRAMIALLPVGGNAAPGVALIDPAARAPVETPARHVRHAAPSGGCRARPARSRPAPELSLASAV